MRICLLEILLGQLQLASVLIKIYTLNGEPQLVKTLVLPTRLNASKENVTSDNINRNEESETNLRSEYVKKGHKRKVPSNFNNRKVRQINWGIYEEDEVSLYGGSDLNANIQQLTNVVNKSYKVGMGYNTAPSDDGKFMNSVVNDLITFENIREPVLCYDQTN